MNRAEVVRIARERMTPEYLAALKTAQALQEEQPMGVEEALEAADRGDYLDAPGAMRALAAEVRRLRAEQGERDLVGAEVARWFEGVGAGEGAVREREGSVAPAESQRTEPEITVYPESDEDPLS
jgi:hypothetical protein